MKRVIFTDPKNMEVLNNRISIEADPELVAEVNRALEQLEPRFKELLKMWYYDGARIKDMAQVFDMSESEISGLLYEAKRQMKILLADFVKKRWGVDAGGLCRICAHPRRDDIEEILSARGRNESWRSINDRLSEVVGEKFQPPQILKAHIKHMNRNRTGENEKR